ncbi:MAG TPA: IS66 family transposase zinc-finger binding domain-containing protein, partial [Xanthomonadales bacterium]|nr:IS66 family transposase zinc-finger binding domain-containing protein [Xanthomonadales bacterium]
MNAAAFDHVIELEMLRAQIAQRDAVIAKRDAEIQVKSVRIDQLEHLLRVLKRQQYSASAEKFDPTQQALFDAAADEEIASAQSEIEVLVPPSRERTQPKRQPLPPELPRVEERIEPASCTCAACGGELHCIGEEVSEKLDVKPVEFFVRRIIRPKLACRGCETIHTPPT